MASGTYKIGTGIYDITGPAAEVGMMGYSEPDQKTLGILSRLYARAFVIEERGTRVAIVVADTWSCTQAVKMEVVKRLKDRFGPETYTACNVLITGTHTHSAPGGTSHYPLYNVSTGGFVKQNFDCVVNGMVESIARATANLQDGEIFANQGLLLNCGLNRSLEAYERNPAEERINQQPTDQEMTVLKFVSSQGGRPLGVLTWYPIHPTSLGQNNRLISGDNKGYASYLFERAMGTNVKDRDTFVAAFANSNCGDVSGNVAFGVPLGQPQDYEHMKLYGRLQFEKARELFDSASRALPGLVDYRHVHVDMSNVRNAQAARITAPAAIGVSMFAGSTEDSQPTVWHNPVFEGLGIPPEIEGKTKTKDFSLPNQEADLEIKRNLLASLTTVGMEVAIPPDSEWPQDFEKLHGEKPIIAALGLAEPYPATPEVLPLQLIRIGTLALAAIPAEITTMAGRRLRSTIAESLAPQDDLQVILAAYANAYAGYITTREEYDAQHYEGASTHFGPNTLAAYQGEFARLATAMRDNEPPAPDIAEACADAEAEVRDLSHAVRAANIAGRPDRPLPSHQFGDVIFGRDAAPRYACGHKVIVQFCGADPKHDLRLQDTYLRVQKNAGVGGVTWQDIFSDHDDCTEFRWTGLLDGSSIVTVAWTIPDDAEPGTYCVRYDGTSRPSYRLRFRNFSNARVTLRLFHPADPVRLIPRQRIDLAANHQGEFQIPRGWDRKAQVQFDMPGQAAGLHTLEAGALVDITPSQAIQVTASEEADAFSGTSRAFEVVEHVPAGELLFTNLCDGPVTIRLFNPADMVRAIPRQIIVLLANDNEGFQIPGSWGNRAQALFEIPEKDPQLHTIAGGKLVDIRASKDIQVR